MISMKEIEGLEVSSMLKRTITAVLLLAVFGIAFAMGKDALSFLIQLLILVAGYEIYRIKKEVWPTWLLVVILALLVGANFIPLNMILGFISIVLFTILFSAILSTSFTLDDALFVFFMVVVLSLAIFSIRQVLDYKLTVFIYIIIATFSTDTFAYLGGSLFGKHKLIERISPNKTVEGAMIGYVASVILSLTFAYFFLDLNKNIIYFASFLIPIISQMGDLTFSMVKRHYSIKDFGTIFPGHGGALDRIDSIIFSLLAFNMIVTLVG